MTGAAPPVAVVTGAGRGIGRAVARRLAAGGHHVVAAARTRSELEASARAAGPRVTAVVADVAVAADVARVAEAAGGLGRLVAWVNNAAVVEPTPFAQLDARGWDRVLAVNLRGAFLGCSEAFRRMAASGGGTIVNIASLSGVPNVEKFPGQAAYNVSKAGLVALTESIAVEGRAHGVRAIALSPGAVDTDMLRRAAPHLRPGVTPEEVAEIVAFLASDAAAALTGVNIPIHSNA